MSPLTCSLFALAAVFATAHGGDSSCTSLLGGRQSINETILPPVDFQPPGAKVDVPYGLDLCPPSMVNVGLHIEACNNDSDGVAPVIIQEPSKEWFPYYVFCKTMADCPNGGYYQATLYCDMPTNSKH